MITENQILEETCPDVETPLVVSEDRSPPPHCSVCEKKFRIYRKRYGCHDCGASLCHRCLDSDQVCKRCALKRALTPLVEWACPDVAFDADEALSVLRNLADEPQVRAVVCRRSARGTSTTASPGRIRVEMVSIETERVIREGTSRMRCDGVFLRAPEGALVEWGPALLQLDESLPALRFACVPSKVKEAVFWDRYFQEAALALRRCFGMCDQLTAVDDMMSEMELGLHTAYAETGGIGQQEHALHKLGAADELYLCHKIDTFPPDSPGHVAGA